MACKCHGCHLSHCWYHISLETIVMMVSCCVETDQLLELNGDYFRFVISVRELGMIFHRHAHFFQTSCSFVLNHRRRFGWNSGETHDERRRWVGAEWGMVCGGMTQLTAGSGKRCELPSKVRSRALTENGFWRILKAIERSFLYLYDKICSMGNSLH